MCLVTFHIYQTISNIEGFPLKRHYAFLFSGPLGIPSQLYKLLKLTFFILCVYK